MKEPIMMKVADLIPYENNTKKHDRNVDLIANSIEEFGFKGALIVDKNNVIIAGHGRRLALMKLGIENVPVIVADDLDEAQIKAMRLADNEVSKSKDDKRKLEHELAELAALDVDMVQFGFPEYTFDEEEVEPEPEIPFSQELGEENNSITLFFDNSVDWLQAQTVFGLRPVQALHSKEGFKVSGVGRVANGSKLLSAMIEAGVDIEGNTEFAKTVGENNE